MLLVGGFAAIFGLGFVGAALALTSKLTPVQIARQSKVLAIAVAQGPWDTVVIGDSIVQQSHIESLCGRTLNAGVGGIDADSAADFAPKLLAITHPKRVIVAVGANDALRVTDPDVYARNVDRIVRLATDSGAQVTVSEIAPFGAHFAPSLVAVQPPSAQAVLANAGRRAEALNARLAHYHPLQMHAALSGPDGKLPEGMSGDGVHLSPTGYKPWRTQMAKACSGAV